MQVAAENINLAFVKLNINTPHQTAHRHVRFPVLPAMENIPDVLARAVSAPVLMVVKNIILPLAQLFVKRLIRIIVETEPQFQLLMVALNIGPIALQNAKLLIMITAAIGLPLVLLTVVKNIMPIVSLSAKLPKLK